MELSVGFFHLKRNTELVDSVCASLIEGKYWAVLGPRFFGKAAFLRQIEDRLQNEPGLKCLFVNLRKYAALNRHEYYQQMYKDITGELSIEPVDIPRITTRGIFEDVLNKMPSRLILLFSGIESLNEDLARELLLNLRRFYDQRNLNSSFRNLGAVVSGSVNLQRLSRGQGSPFNIAELIFIKPLSEEETLKFIETLGKGFLSIDKKKYLYRLTRGHPYLIEAILNLMVEDGVDGAVDAIISMGIDTPCFETIVKNLERSRETFRTFKEIIFNKQPKLSDASLPTEPEITGLFIVNENYTYEISNEIFARFLDTYLDNQKLADLFLLHGDWHSAKQYYLNKGKQWSIKEQTVRM